MLVVGLDLSYFRTGLALLEAGPDGSIIQWSIHNFKTSPKDSLLYRTYQIDDWLSFHLYDCEYALKDGGIFSVEKSVFGGKRAAMMAGLNVTITSMLFERYVYGGKCDMLLVRPDCLKRYVGIKNKEKPTPQFRALHPEVKKVCHDEADAYFLARLALDYKRATGLGVPVTLSKKTLSILFSETKNKKGKPAGIALRHGEFFYQGTLNGIREERKAD